MKAKGLARAEQYRSISLSYAMGEIGVQPGKPVKSRRLALKRARNIKKKFARDMRQNMTPAERHLWEGGLENLKRYFDAQIVVFGYIGDFVCFRRKLIVEVDGEYHSTPEQTKLDNQRTEHLSRHGFRVIRFTNREVFADRQRVIGKIVESM